MDDYFTAAHNLATIVRRAFDGKVKRSELKKALEAFEQVDMQSKA